MAELMTNHRLYNIWNQMRQRCFNDRNPNYKRYGARGIIICERWLNFWNFVEDMDSLYEKGLTIERINNDGNYELKNCKWIPKGQQSLNTRNVVNAKRFTYQGFTGTIRELSKRFGLKRSTLDMRIKYGWSIENALTKGVQR